MSPTTVVRPDPYWLVAAGLVVADQLTKLLVTQSGINVSFAGVSIGTVINPAGVLGFQIANGVLIAVGIVLVVGLLAAIATGIERPPVRLGVWLILAGALSNVLDRIFAGGAVDIISFAGLSRFNLADVLIILGVASILRGLWWRES